MNMLKFNYSSNHHDLSKMNKNLNFNAIDENLENVYRNSETLSNHISNNILESLKEQFSRQGLQVYVESEQELETAD